MCCYVNIFFITFLNFIFIKCVDKLTKICYNKGLWYEGVGFEVFCVVETTMGAAYIVKNINSLSIIKLIT